LASRQKCHNPIPPQSTPKQKIVARLFEEAGYYFYYPTCFS